MGRYSLGGTTSGGAYQGAKESIEFFEAHAVAGIHVNEIFVKEVEISVGQGFGSGLAQEILHEEMSMLTCGR